MRRVSVKLSSIVIGCIAAMLTDAFAANPARRDRWIGVWQGKLEGLPGVTLTLADDTEELGGTIVFNVVDSMHSCIAVLSPASRKS